MQKVIDYEQLHFKSVTVPTKPEVAEHDSLVGLLGGKPVMPIPPLPPPSTPILLPWYLATYSSNPLLQYVHVYNTQ